MMKYDSYKDSGIDWLGKENPIPAHWAIKRVKDLGNYQSGIFIDANEIDAEGTYPVYGGNGIRGFTDRYNHSGDYILIGRQGALCGNINYANGKFWATEHAVVIYKNKDYNLIWLGELFRVMNFNQYSLSAAQPGLSVDRIKRLELPMPPFKEQTAIAKYLDTKTQAIDKKVSLLEKKIGYYQELRKSLINETVTKGLDKNVKLKDSGIDWIGQIPEHWEVKRGKDIFKEISRKNRPDLPLLAASQKQGVVLKSMLESRSMEAQKSFEIFKWVKPKDFVISLRSFEGGIETAFYEGIISPAYTVFNFRTNGSITSYFTHLFKSACFIDFLQSSITGIRDGQSVKFIELERAFFAIPPVSEQEQIADYLTEKTSKIDQIMTNIQTQIATLKELRKTLINDVVTGKIKVSES